MKKLFTLACATIMAVSAMAQSQTQLTIQIKKDNKNFLELGELTNKGTNMTAVPGSALEAFTYSIDLEAGEYQVYIGGTKSDGSAIGTAYAPKFTLTSTKTVHFWGRVQSGKNYVDGLCTAVQYGMMDGNWCYYAPAVPSYESTTLDAYFVMPVSAEWQKLKVGAEVKVLADNVLTGNSTPPFTLKQNGTYVKSIQGVKKAVIDYATWTATIYNLDAIDVNITSAGASTLCCPNPLTIPSGVKAYTLSHDGSAALIATEVTTTIPANTPVLLNGAEGTYTFNFAGDFVAPGTAKTTTSKDYMPVVTASGNVLNGIYNSMYVPQNSYVLQNGENGVGFYKVDVTNYPVNAFRCYVSLPAADAHAKLNIVFPEDIPTGISNIATAQNNTMFNIAGQRVNSNTKGIVIKNGKKYLNK